MELACVVHSKQVVSRHKRKHHAKVWDVDSGTLRAEMKYKHLAPWQQGLWGSFFLTGQRSSKICWSIQICSAGKVTVAKRCKDLWHPLTLHFSGHVPYFLAVTASGHHWRRKFRSEEHNGSRHLESKRNWLGGIWMNLAWSCRIFMKLPIHVWANLSVIAHTYEVYTMVYCLQRRTVLVNIGTKCWGPSHWILSPSWLVSPVRMPAQEIRFANPAILLLRKFTFLFRSCQFVCKHRTIRSHRSAFL